MIGGNNYRKSQFNLAVQGERQPGSSFKPFVLATALKDGISPDSEFESGPVQIPLGDKIWYVHNYENSDLGRISLATATEVSDNTVYAQLTQLVGPGAIVRTAKKLGITSPLKKLLRDRARRRGRQPARDGARVLGLRQRRGANRRRRLRQPPAGDLVRPERGGPAGRQQPAGAAARADREHGGARHLAAAERRRGPAPARTRSSPDGRPVAGKTGTTENYGDAWFVGYTPQLVAAVWVGYPTTLQADADRVPRRRRRRRHLPGADLEDASWSGRSRTCTTPPTDFPSLSLPYSVPRTVVYRNGQLELDNGNCNSTKQLLYFAGERPARTANCKVNEVDVPQGRRRHDLAGERPPRRAAADAAVRLRAGEAAAEARRRRAAVPGEGDALVLRQGDARPAEGAAGRRAEGRRPAARRGPRRGSSGST